MESIKKNNYFVRILDAIVFLMKVYHIKLIMNHVCLEYFLFFFYLNISVYAYPRRCCSITKGKAIFPY